MNYGDILYHQPNNESMNSKLESVQYSAAFSITGVIKGTSRLKLYKRVRTWDSKVRKDFQASLFISINCICWPSNLFFQLNPQIHSWLSNRASANIPTYQCRTDISKYFVFPWTIITLNKIHPETQNASLTVFKKLLLKEICPVLHSVYNICKWPETTN